MIGLCACLFPSCTFLITPGDSLFDDQLTAARYGVAGFLVLYAMIYLMDRAVNSMTVKYGDESELTRFDWRSDAKVFMLASSLCAVQFMLLAAVYYIFGGMTEFDPRVYYIMACGLLCVLTSRRIKFEVYRYLLRIYFRTRRPLLVQ